MKVKNLEVAFESKSGNSFALLNNNKLFEMASQVDLSMSSDNIVADDNISLMKSEEVNRIQLLEECNPEITLPINLDVAINSEDIPPMNNNSDILKTTLLKEIGQEEGERSWAKVVGQKRVISKSVNNDMSLLECQRSNKASRVKCVADFIVNNNISFMGLQETKKEMFSEAMLKAINPSFSWH